MFLARLIYYSRPIHLDSDELRDISEVSRANNYLDGVTGALFFSGEWFVQVLEGARTVLSPRFARIVVDTRHRDVTLMEFRAIDERVFSDWEMRYIGAGPETDRIIRRFMPGEFDPRVVREGEVMCRLLRALIAVEGSDVERAIAV